jgi:hypothetical protein
VKKEELISTNNDQKLSFLAKTSMRKIETVRKAAQFGKNTGENKTFFISRADL